MKKTITTRLAILLNSIIKMCREDWGLSLARVAEILVKNLDKSELKYLIKELENKI